MSELPDCSVHLVVTSPPYNVGKQYDDDLSLDEYMGLLKRVFAETYRVLVPGGRACINVANLGRKPYIPLNSYISRAMQESGFLMRGEILWDKGSSVGSSTAWGTYMKAWQPRAARCARVYPGFLQAVLHPSQSAQKKEHHLQGGVFGVHEKCMEVRVRACRENRPPGPFSGGVATPFDPALYFRRRGGSRSLRRQRFYLPGRPAG